MENKYKLDYVKIAARVKAARRSAGMTQAELAEKIGISTNAVAKLENSLMTASLQTLINISNVLNIDINYLLSDGGAETDTELDVLLAGMIKELSPEDKGFIVHMIHGLNRYKRLGGGEESVDNTPRCGNI